MRRIYWSAFSVLRTQLGRTINIRTGTYPGIVHSHLDVVDCHMMVNDKGYPDVRWKTSRLRAVAQGWLEPGTAIHREDLEAAEKLEQVKVSPGDVILLYTGHWKRRAALGAWP